MSQKCSLVAKKPTEYWVVLTKASLANQVFANQFWASHFKKEVDRLEKVRQRAVK